MQGREKKHWLHQFALYPSKGFGPEAQSKFLYRKGAYRRIGVSEGRRVGAVAGRNRSGKGRICEPGAMDRCGNGVAEHWGVLAKVRAGL
jgi:hypothetical protein